MSTQALEALAWTAAKKAAKRHKLPAGAVYGEAWLQCRLVAEKVPPSHPGRAGCIVARTALRLTDLCAGRRATTLRDRAAPMESTPTDRRNPETPALDVQEEVTAAKLHMAGWVAQAKNPTEAAKREAAAECALLASQGEPSARLIDHYLAATGLGGRCSASYSLRVRLARMYAHVRGALAG